MKAELERIIGPVDRLTAVTGGYTHNERAIAVLRDGRSAFVKRAVDDETSGWLRREHQMYEALAGKRFLPTVLGWSDEPLPMLVLEDLSRAAWPPPWTPSRIDDVLAMLADVAAAAPPPGLPVLADGEQPEEGWHRVMADPAEFLALGVCEPAWLTRAGPVLLAAASRAPLAGAALLHYDVRSDNICFLPGRALLVDWNLASIGNPLTDVAFWLPSLETEQGPPPQTVAPGVPPELAAYVAGFFASRAGQPLIPHAPGVRQVQLRQLRTALPWAARALDLPPPA